MQHEYSRQQYRSLSWMFPSVLLTLLRSIIYLPTEIEPYPSTHQISPLVRRCSFALFEIFDPTKGIGINVIAFHGTLLRCIRIESKRGHPSKYRISARSSFGICCFINDLIEHLKIVIARPSERLCLVCWVPWLAWTIPAYREKLR